VTGVLSQSIRNREFPRREIPEDRPAHCAVMPLDGNFRPLPAIVRPVGRWLLRRWARSGRKASRLFRLVERWGPRLADRPLQTRLPNGCVVSCDLGEFIQRQVYFMGLFEPIESFLLTRLLRPGMTVIDAGANIGQYTLLAATAVGPTGMVHSFEPVPTTFDHLRLHVSVNHLTNVTLNRMAIWHEDSTVTLALPREYSHNAGTWAIGAHESRMAPITAEAIRLDAYAAQRGLSRVDVIKLDIQGAEPFAIAGAHELLAQCRPILLMEVDRASLLALGSSPEMLWQELHRLGYLAWRIRPSRKNSGPVPNLDGVELENFFFHYTDLPPEVTSGWHRPVPKQWACSGWSVKPSA
jgi:FkbM family methyltransferase